MKQGGKPATISRKQVSERDWDEGKGGEERTTRRGDAETGKRFAEEAEVIGGEEEYEIDAILRHKKEGKGIKFLVHWKGYEDAKNMWLPQRELERNAKELLDEYRRLKGL